MRPFSKFIPGVILLIHLWPLRNWIYGTRLARMGQVKFVESNLWSWSILEYLDPYGTICPFKQRQSWPRRCSGKKCSKNITIFPGKQLWWSPFIKKLKARFAVLLKGIYLYIWIYIRNNRERSEICSKLTMKTPKWRHWNHSDVFSVNFEHISHFLCSFYCWIWTGKCLLGWQIGFDCT